MKKTIWGNTIVKNEDKYLFFAITSVIDYLDKILIWDTGSTDNTIDIIKYFKEKYPQKIEDKYFTDIDPDSFTKLRQKMLDETKSAWFLILDGDEVWWKDSIKSVVTEINRNGNDLDCIVTPTINLIGDIYHFQEENAGNYNLLGRKGHLNIRAINRKIPGLHLDLPYGSEGYFDKNNVAIQERDAKNMLFLDKPYLHFTHLKRSSAEEGDNKTMMRRQKIKYEIGDSFKKDFEYPEALYEAYPDFVDSPFYKMSGQYKIRAIMETPLKKIKRRISR